MVHSVDHKAHLEFIQSCLSKLSTWVQRKDLLLYTDTLAPFKEIYVLFKKKKKSTAAGLCYHHLDVLLAQNSLVACSVLIKFKPAFYKFNCHGLSKTPSLLRCLKKADNNYLTCRATLKSVHVHKRTHRRQDKASVFASLCEQERCVTRTVALPLHIHTPPPVCLQTWRQ